MFMTISQLAACLGYADKSGVEKIVQRNPYLKEKQFSCTDVLSVQKGANSFSKQETRIFTEDGCELRRKTPVFRHGEYAKEKVPLVTGGT